MKYLQVVFFSVCLASFYYALTLTALGFSAANQIFWWFEWTEHFHFYHIAQNFFGIGLAALIPAYLIHSYEPDRKWISATLVIVITLILLGNINHVPWDPQGIVRFFESSVLTGDLGSIGVFIEIIAMPVLWLLLFAYAARQRRGIFGHRHRSDHIDM